MAANPDINVLSRILEDVSATFDVGVDAMADILFENSDDWSFLIKVHALMETAVTQIIASASGDLRLRPVFQRLSEGWMTQKLQYAELMDMLSKPRIQFARAVGMMRNYAVHDIRNLGFTFRTYFEAKPEVRNSLVESLTQVGKPEQFRPKVQELVDTVPRQAIWIGTIYMLVGAHGAHRVAPPVERVRTLNEQILELLLGPNGNVKKEAPGSGGPKRQK